VYFLVKGTVGYVLPRLENKAYLLIDTGQHFGHIDLAADKSFLDLLTVGRTRMIQSVVRTFTVQAFTTCELLQLSINDLYQMKHEFPMWFVELFAGAFETYMRDIMLKIQVIKQSQLIEMQLQNQQRNKIKDTISYSLLGGLLKKIGESSKNLIVSPSKTEDITLNV
jgi:hypothetical protein